MLESCNSENNTPTRLEFICAYNDHITEMEAATEVDEIATGDNWHEKFIYKYDSSNISKMNPINNNNNLNNNVDDVTIINTLKKTGTTTTKSSKFVRRMSTMLQLEENDDNNNNNNHSGNVSNKREIKAELSPYNRNDSMLDRIEYFRLYLLLKREILSKNWDLKDKDTWGLATYERDDPQDKIAKGLIEAMIERQEGFGRIEMSFDIPSRLYGGMLPDVIRYYPSAGIDRDDENAWFPNPPEMLLKRKNIDTEGLLKEIHLIIENDIDTIQSKTFLDLNNTEVVLSTHVLLMDEKDEQIQVKHLFKIPRYKKFSNLLSECGYLIILITNILEYFFIFDEFSKLTNKHIDSDGQGWQRYTCLCMLLWQNGNIKDLVIGFIILTLPVHEMKRSKWSIIHVIAFWFRFVYVLLLIPSIFTHFIAWAVVFQALWFLMAAAVLLVAVSLPINIWVCLVITLRRSIKLQKKPKRKRKRTKP